MSQSQSHTVQALNEAEAAKPIPDFFRYKGFVYARLAAVDVAPDFIQTAVEVDVVKRNLNRECLRACKRRNLPMGVMISPAVKYDIAVEIGIKDVGELTDFKAEQSAYQLVGKMMAELGYKQKRGNGR